ncbi:unnamed protein product [Paramecium primaurelia]|uniref:Uncharacterized protein n=1 Tax=Paramecium primaurelia TaxID=5886 RepID=A0A8S1KQ70_PARPR|nr:unnamed protein product [Paramecium primaurelia]
MNQQLQQQVCREIIILQNNFQAQLGILQIEQGYNLICYQLQKIYRKNQVIKLLYWVDSAKNQITQISQLDNQKNIHDIKQNLSNKIIEQSQINTDLKIQIQNFEQSKKLKYRTSQISQNNKNQIQLYSKKLEENFYKID